MEKIFTVQSWGDFQDKLFFDTHDSKIDRYRSPYIYRGVNISSDPLTTSIARLGEGFEKLEGHLLRNFRKYAHANEFTDKRDWNWLALAQHHGLPTRLLDWTYSPLIAAHFALNDIGTYNQDGVIWALNYVKLNDFLPERYKKIIKKEQSNTFTAEMLDSVSKNLKGLEKSVDEPFLLFLEPPSLDNRIINQYALFSLLSNATIQLDDWLKHHKDLYFKIIIPKELKWEFRDKLDQSNITERVLTPSLDGLSLWLKRQYSSKNKR